jgi:hypothetical protein
MTDHHAYLFVMLVGLTIAFILNDLNRTIENENSFAFSYSPIDKSVVYNASLLGARLLARVYFYKKEKMLQEVSFFLKDIIFIFQYSTWMCF